MNTKTVAAYCDFAPDIGEQVRQATGSWPVSRDELTAEIERQAHTNDWEVSSISEPVERGPLRCHAVDPETGVWFEYDRYQLYSYVEVS